MLGRATFCHVGLILKSYTFYADFLAVGVGIGWVLHGAL